MFAVVFLFALHSLSVIKILVILLVNFLISYFHPSSPMVPALTWLINLAFLFGNEYYKGYQFRQILPFLIAGEGEGVGYRMDHFMGGGILRRWEVSFNITVLRMISYNMDHYWAAVCLKKGESEAGSVIEVGHLESAGDLEQRRGSEQVDSRFESGDRTDDSRLMINEQIKKNKADPTQMSESDRNQTPANMEDYGLLNYLAYILYTPLYLAGPIITFNDFTHQVGFCYYLPSLTKLTIASLNTPHQRSRYAAGCFMPSALPLRFLSWRLCCTTSTWLPSPRLLPEEAGPTTLPRSWP